MPHNFLLGHLLIAAKVTMKHPTDIAVSLVPWLIAEDYPEFAKNGYFYLDMWPVAAPMICVLHPDIMAQITQDPSLPKHVQMPFEFGPLTHAKDLVTSNGQIWKTWRKIFSPGFSAQNVQTYIPAMLEEYNVFRSKLGVHAANGEIINLDKTLMAVTVDIIGHAVLYELPPLLSSPISDHFISSGARFGAQTGRAEMFEALKAQVAQLVVDYSPVGLYKLLNPLRPLRIWNNNRIMRNNLLPYILECVRDREEKEGNKTMLKVRFPQYLL